MQDASQEMIDALARSSVVWEPTVEVDWDRDGYDGPATLDDLSTQADTIQVVQSMDDGLPDEVSLLNNSGIPAATVKLGGRSSLVQLYDRFGRSLTGGWGYSESGHAWEVMTVTADGTTPDNSLVEDGVGKHRLSANSTFVRVGNQGVQFTDGWVKAVWSPSTVAIVSGSLIGYLYARTSADLETRYGVLAHINPSGVVSVELIRVLNGATTSLDTDSDIFADPAVDGVQIGMVLEVNGTTVRAKVWQGDLTSEPDATDWNVEATDTTIAGPGGVGCQSWADSTAIIPGDLPLDVSWDDFLAIPRRGSAAHQILTPTQYFSPFQPRSPLYGKPRDLGPAQISQGLVTDDGVESVIIFSGRVADTPVGGGRASLAMRSQARQELSLLVHPKPHSSQQFMPTGLTATWPIVWALDQCEVYSHPPPDGDFWTIIRAPLHGGMFYFYPNDFDTFGDIMTVDVEHWQRLPIDADEVQRPPRWIRGPYVGALYGEATADRVQGTTWLIPAKVDDSYPNSASPTEDAPDWFSQADSRGRIEFWVRGDAFDLTNSPSGATYFDFAGSLALAGPVMFICNPGSAAIVGGIDLNRRVFVTFKDATNSFTLTSSATLPTDGLWHAVGFAWDAADEDAWTYLDGVVTTGSAGFAFNTANLPATNGGTDMGFLASQMHIYLPLAEFIFTGGDGADPDIQSWLWDLPFSQDAFVYPSNLPLVSTAIPDPMQAWDLIATYARAEIAAMGIDESDNFHYRPVGWFATEAAQTVADTLTTEFNSATPDVTMDPTLIRTAARVSYNPTSVNNRGFVLQFRGTIQIPPHAQVLVRLALDHLTMLLAGSLVTHDDTDPPPTGSYYQINDDSIAGGTWGDEDDVSCDVSEWNPGTVSLLFTNNTGTTWYVVGDTQASIGIYGTPIVSGDSSESELYDSAVELRGIRTLTVDLERIQDSETASQVARRLLGMLKDPQVVVSGAEVFGDPRRQPGDLVLLQDTQETGIQESMRLHSIRHSSDGGRYTQVITGKKSRPVGTWGESRWGQCVWAGQEAERA